MDDLDIEQLRSGWRGERADVELQLSRLRRRRWMPVTVFLAEVGAAAVAACLGAWLIWLGMRTHQASYSTLGAPLFVCGFSLAFVLADARRDSLAWRDQTPSDLLRTGLTRVDASLRVTGIMRWYALGIALLLVGGRIAGFAKGDMPSTGGWLAWAGGLTLCALYWLWLTARSRRTRMHRSVIARLLAEEDRA
jgi:hypothetical protein